MARQARKTRGDGPRHHVVLVPGFGGFDILGPLKYYEGVIDYLRTGGADGLALSVHFFPNLPTAGVPTRASMLARWIGKRVHRGTIRLGDDPGGSDRLHLVGHSTGGLDIRGLVALLRRGEAADLFDFAPAARREALCLELGRSIDTAQFLSTPHRGSNLARWACAAGRLPRCLARRLFCTVRHLGPVWTRRLGDALSDLHGAGGPRDWCAAAADALSACHSSQSSLDAARARETYYAILRWLDEMRSEAGALTSLDPVVGGRPDGAGRAFGPRDDPRWYDDAGIAVRSIVTHAPRRRRDRCSIYAALDFVVRAQAPEALGGPATIRLLLDPSQRVTIRTDMHDGVVNSVSMVWPDEERSLAICGDHADVVGHYAGAGPRGYDLLPSGAPFGTREFEQLWLGIRGFIERSARPRGR